MRKFFKKFEVLYYGESSRPFGYWIGFELSHQKNTKVYVLEIGFWFCYLEINYDGTNYTDFN